MKSTETAGSILTPREISNAAARLAGYLKPTALEHSTHYSALPRCKVLLKCEHHQPTGSFKVRGALNAVLQLGSGTRGREIITASSGNHGAAVSWVAKQLGGRALVYTSEHASAAKVDNIRRLGGELVLCAGEYVEIEALARKTAAERGMAYVSPYNHAEVIAGQGTIGFEIGEACEQLDAVFVTVGGGGLISGTALWLKHRFPGVRVFGCLPANSPHMREEVRGGDMEKVPNLPTLSDGSAGSIEAGSITIDLCRRLIDEFVEVSETEIAREIRDFLDFEHALIEGSAAVPLAALRRSAGSLANRTVAVVISGRNIASADLQHALTLSQ